MKKLHEHEWTHVYLSFLRRYKLQEYMSDYLNSQHVIAVKWWSACDLWVIFSYFFQDRLEVAYFLFIYIWIILYQPIQNFFCIADTYWFG